jgi:hypothetical protein
VSLSTQLVQLSSAKFIVADESSVHEIYYTLEGLLLLVLSRSAWLKLLTRL